MTTFTVGVVTAGKLVVTGFCLGLGFWVCRKLTNKLDEKLVLGDKDYMEALAGFLKK